MRTNRLANIKLGRRSVILIPLCLLALAVLPAVAPAGDAPMIFVMDRCEPDSFNAVLGEDGCVRNGGVTFDVFESQLNPQDGGHNAWRNSRHDIVLAGDQHLTAVNSGGETHTFTEVVSFGAGIVPPLNAALPPGTPPAQPVGGLNFFGAGETLDLDTLPAGTHRFQCLIHPWMRTVVEQR